MATPSRPECGRGAPGRLSDSALEDARAVCIHFRHDADRRAGGLAEVAGMHRLTPAQADALIRRADAFIERLNARRVRS